jgi:glutaconate CoA-transferase subunit B
MNLEYSNEELLAVAASREMVGVSTIFAGVGIPLLAALLAKQTHLPGLTIVVEGGSIGPQVLPGYLPISTNEMRISHGAQQLVRITDIFLLTQRGFLEVGFIGGAQIDRHGNINTTVIGNYEKPKVRLPGSGGANDIASLCRELIVVTKHERRRFVPEVDFVTSPGYLDGGSSRHDAGLIFGGVRRVITDLAIMGFDEESKAMQLEYLHPDVTLDQVRENTGFELLIPDEIPVTDPPRAEELEHLRRIDVDRRFL